jgi:hypothetical protein
MITSNFEEKLQTVENKVDEIADKLLEFEHHFSESSLIDGERVS